MYPRKLKVVGRSVTALAIGLALTVGSASLASASSHHGNAFRDHGVASGKVSRFDNSHTGAGGYVTVVTATYVTVELRNGVTATFTLTPTTTYTEGSAPTTIAALVVGDRVRVQLSPTAPTTATSVTIELAELFGKVTAVGTGTITISGPQGFSRTIVVNSSTSYTSNGAAGTLADVVVGSHIFAQGTIDPNRTSLDALSVNIRTDQHLDSVEGTVTALTTSSITVQDHNGTSTMITLTPTTTYSEGSTTTSASALALGEHVSVKVNSSAPTTALSVRIQLAQVAGDVTAILGDSITLNTHHGSSLTVLVSDATTYSQQGASATLADVVVGSKIVARGNYSADQTTFDAITVKIGHPDHRTNDVAVSLNLNGQQGNQDGQGN